MSESKKIPLILDGDPGHDDAIAWMLAKASPVFDIRAVTTCAGNQTIEKTTYNARRICALLGIDAPVAMGRPAPLPTPSPPGTSTARAVWTAPPCPSLRTTCPPWGPWS